MLITNGKISRNIDPKRFAEYKAKGYVEVTEKTVEKPSEKTIEKVEKKGKK